MTITVRKLLEDPLLGLSVESGESGLERAVTTAELNRPSLELTGYFGAFRSERIQVFGNGEINYIEEHSRDAALLEHLARIFGERVPCAIVTNGRTPPGEINRPLPWDDLTDEQRRFRRQHLVGSGLRPAGRVPR